MKNINLSKLKRLKQLKQTKYPILVEQKKDLWDKINLIATFMVAVMAVAGFSYAVKSSKETSKAIKSVTDGIKSFTSPVIYFSEYTWLIGKNFDCENPPNAINVKFENGSNMPIKVINSHITIGTYINDKIKLNYQRTLLDSTEHIITDKYPMALTFPIYDEMKKVLINKTKGKNPPFVYLRFNGKISNLSESIIYNVQLGYFIEYDCEALNIHSITINENHYEPILNE